MPPTKDYCMLREVSGIKKIVPLGLITLRNNRKQWITPSAAVIREGKGVFFTKHQGKRRRVDQIISVGTLEEIRNSTSGTLKRVPISKRKTFSPHNAITKTVAAREALFDNKQKCNADRQTMQKAKVQSLRDADTIYSTFESGLAARKLTSETSVKPVTEVCSVPNVPEDVRNNSNRPDDVYEFIDESDVRDSSAASSSARQQKGEATRLSPSPSEQLSSSVDSTETTRLMPRSLTCYDLNVDTHSRGNIYTRASPAKQLCELNSPKFAPPTLPSSAALMPVTTGVGVTSSSSGLRSDLPTSTPKSKKRRSSVLSAIPMKSQTSFEGSDSSDEFVYDASPSGQIQFQKAMVHAILQIKSALNRLKSKIITQAQIKTMLQERNVVQPVSKVSDSSDKENDWTIMPDAKGNVELYPGLVCSFDAVTPALLAKTMRKRSNEVMKLLWPEEKISRLYVKMRTARSKKSFETERPKGINLHSRDYSRIINICRQMQSMRKLPTDLDSDKIELNVRQWASDWLKNQRFRMKPT